MIERAPIGSVRRRARVIGEHTINVRWGAVPRYADPVHVDEATHIVVGIDPATGFIWLRTVHGTS